MTERTEPHDAQPDWTSGREAVFRELRRRSPEHASHLGQLFARYGPSILDRGVPYLLVALRRVAIDEHRRDLREARIAEQLSNKGVAPFTEADPAEIVISRASLDSAIRAIMTLGEADGWALWWHAAGHTDDEIVRMWSEAGFEPSHPTPALVRKRRERARKRLRELVRAE